MKAAQSDEEGAAPVEGKATFGFQAQARDRDGDGQIDDVKGKLQYNDHGNGVAFHGDVLDGGKSPYKIFSVCIGGECKGGEEDENGNPILSENVFVASGTYQPIPATLGPGGEFEAMFVDWGQPGPDEGDYLRVQLNGGVFDGYQNVQFIKGGNLSAHSR